MVDTKITGNCPKCGCKPSGVVAGHHGPSTWACGSGWDRLFEPPVFVQSEPCAALARKDRVIAVLLPIAIADWCPPGPCKGLRAPIPKIDCRSCVLAWAEAEADKDCDGEGKK